MIRNEEKKRPMERSAERCRGSLSGSSGSIQAVGKTFARHRTFSRSLHIACRSWCAEHEPSSCSRFYFSKSPASLDRTPSSKGSLVETCASRYLNFVVYYIPFSANMPIIICYTSTEGLGLEGMNWKPNQEVARPWRDRVIEKKDEASDTARSLRLRNA